MLKYSDLNGRNLKKAIYGCTRAGLIYHNKHRDGTGNFGIYMDIKGHKYRLDGEYNKNKEVIHLSFGEYGGVGKPITTASFKELVYQINSALRLVPEREVYPELASSPLKYHEKLMKVAKNIATNYNKGYDRNLKEQLHEACLELKLPMTFVMRRLMLFNKPKIDEYDVIWLLTGVDKLHFRKLEILGNAEALLYKSATNAEAEAIMQKVFAIMQKVSPEYKRMQLGTLADFYGKTGRYIPIGVSLAVNLLKR